VIVPWQALRRAGYDVWTQYRAAEIRHHPDVLVFQRGGGRDAGALAGLLALCHAHGTVIAVDHDDDNRIRWDGRPQGQLDVLLVAMRAADLITTTTEHLAARIREENPNVAVLPNLIDPARWTGTWRRSGPVTIGLAGGDTHPHDWEVAGWLFPELARQYPADRVRFLIAGGGPAEWRFDLRERLGDRLTEPAWLPSDRYQEVVNRIDIGLAPLVDNEFNRCRSPLKWLEYSMGWAASVVSPTVYADYVQPGRDALVAETPDDWLRCCSELIESRTRRQTIAARARMRAIRDWNVNDPRHLRARMEAYRGAWERVMGRRYVRTAESA
jgi:hypothetical protein